MRFRPCIDLHQGKVKQIVGSSLEDGENKSLKTNFVADLPPAYYANMYHDDGLVGGHVIMLGPGNQDAAMEALSQHPGTLQIGGGITPENAQFWLENGAQKLIVTSFIFENGQLSQDKLDLLAKSIPRDKLVLDLSCRKQPDGYHVACNRWQTICDTIVDKNLLLYLTKYCDEFLVHAVDVEGKQQGVDLKLVQDLAQWSTVPVTYAGGAQSMDDVHDILVHGKGRVDLTVGSALDIFGGSGIKYKDLVEFDKRQR
ncbi:MAG: phosphoribosylformimino-5-aminoimidazole carboxamide ribotide isomerase [Lentisphaerae bacterium]|jgi:phosphoribosylformimino-5-aminoimidazole carboxamide ribotide isomerase|nr:phosphoribosylformimino-5-aminoimidazole carboxamide ribotide isomerase [Lentisphaerota bacterium]